MKCYRNDIFLIAKYNGTVDNKWLQRMHVRTVHAYFPVVQHYFQPLLLVRLHRRQLAAGRVYLRIHAQQDRSDDGAPSERPKLGVGQSRVARVDYPTRARERETRRASRKSHYYARTRSPPVLFTRSVLYSIRVDVLTPRRVCHRRAPFFPVIPSVFTLSFTRNGHRHAIRDNQPLASNRTRIPTCVRACAADEVWL